MEKPLPTLAATAAGLSLLLLVAAAGAQEAARCRATLEPARVAVQERPVTVNATLSESVEEVEDVVVQDGSGLAIRSVRTEGPADVAIVLDTSSAGAGDWTLTIEGSSTDFEGTVAVTEGPLAPALVR